MPLPSDETYLKALIAEAIKPTPAFARYERECAAAHAKYPKGLPKELQRALNDLYIADYCDNRDSLKGDELEYFLLKEREFSLDTEDRQRLRELHYKFYGLKPAVSMEVNWDGRKVA